MDQPPKRKHQATGKPRGGKRPGAGRPEGSANTLGYGEVRAVKACRLRVPADATPEQAELADRALQRLVDVMEEKVFYQVAGTVLGAATRVREETCGPLKQKHELTGADGEPLSISINFGAPK